MTDPDRALLSHGFAPDPEAPLLARPAGLLLSGVDNPLLVSNYEIVVSIVPLAHHGFPAPPRRETGRSPAVLVGASSRSEPATVMAVAPACPVIPKSVENTLDNALKAQGPHQRCR